MTQSKEKALLLNFPKEKADALVSILGAMVECVDFDLIDRLSHFSKQKLEESYDFVFIDMEGVQEKKAVLFSRIRSMFPFSELFVVNEKENYKVALAALRVGVRDILPFPFEDDEIAFALKMARIFRKKERESQRYLDLAGSLSCVGDIKSFKNFEAVFTIVKRYILNHFAVRRVGAFRYHRGDRSKKFDFKTQGEVLLSDEELYHLSEKGGALYRQKSHYVYLPFFQEQEEVYFLFLETFEDFDTSQSIPLLETLVSVLKICYGYVRASHSEEKMSFLAHTDDVTGLYNQRRLFKDIDINITQAQRVNGCFSLIFVDVDKFKNVNDEYGHIIGSKLLIQIAGVIRQVIRETDYIYRYGGDEFVIILPSVRARDAKRIGERLLERMKDQDFVAGSDQKFKLALSLGIAEYPRDAQSREEILGMADKMMYEAKRAGRGRVCLIT